MMINARRGAVPRLGGAEWNVSPLWNVQLPARIGWGIGVKSFSSGSGTREKMSCGLIRLIGSSLPQVCEHNTKLKHPLVSSTSSSASQQERQPGASGPSIGQLGRSWCQGDGLLST